MAIYYSRTTCISRARGESSVAAAAYRAGACLRDERTGVVHDYSRRRGVLDVACLAPDGAPWARDLAEVWNRAEASEGRMNARTARELVVALPEELSANEAITLARQIGHDLVSAYGVAVLVAVHAPDRGGDERNVHAHILMSTRLAQSESFGAKLRVLDDRHTGPVEARTMRDRMAMRINAALEAAGAPVRVDPRPLDAQARDAADRGDLEAVVRLSRVPQRHEGRAATALRRRGVATHAGSINAGIRAHNRTTAIHGQARAAAIRTRIASQVAVLRHPGLRARQRLSLPPVHAAARSATQVYVQGLADTTALHRQVVANQAAALAASAATFERIRVGWMQRPVAPPPPADAGVPVVRGPISDVPLTSAAPVRPPAPRSLSRRQWAEHRRRERAAATQSVPTPAPVSAPMSRRRPQ